MEAAARTLRQPRTPIAEAGGKRLDRIKLSYGQDRCSSTAATEQRCACDHGAAATGPRTAKAPAARARRGAVLLGKTRWACTLTERPVKSRFSSARQTVGGRLIGRIVQRIGNYTDRCRPRAR